MYSHRLYNVYYIYMYNCTVIGELRLEVIVDLRLASNINLGRVSTTRIFTQFNMKLIKERYNIFGLVSPEATWLWKKC